ncbi:hypothetical protein DdX_19496 [Ditylenchus destructor]|uniref:Uncharacterized protein n=1 Tax=Ditylenchus destructor TaxID=166010 RepID=A0AAD4MN32_9BILA|nr:hypothetical protein DdX_19496 [Ditylenchus destructor]
MNQLDIFGEVLKSTTRENAEKFRQVDRRWNDWIIALETKLPLKSIAQITVSRKGGLYLRLNNDSLQLRTDKLGREIDPEHMATHLRKSAIEHMKIHVDYPWDEKPIPFQWQTFFNALQKLVNFMGCKLVVRKFSYEQTSHRCHPELLSGDLSRLVAQDDDIMIDTLPLLFESVLVTSEVNLWLSCERFKFIMLNPEKIDIESMPSNVRLCNYQPFHCDVILGFMEKLKRGSGRRYSLDIPYAEDDFCEKYFQKFCETNSPEKLFKEIVFGAHLGTHSHDGFKHYKEYGKTLKFLQDKAPVVRVNDDVPSCYGFTNSLTFEYERPDRYVFRVTICAVIGYKVFSRQTKDLHSTHSHYPDLTQYLKKWVIVNFTLP